MRMVIELKRDASSEVVLNQLYRFSNLQMSFGVNMLALNDGRPVQMNLKELLAAFVGFREEVVTRRTKFDLSKARDRGHILVGLAVAVANIDEIIRLIRAAPDAASAREQLMARAWPAKDVAPLVALIADPRHRMQANETIRLSEEQAKAILDLRLQRLTALGRDEINDEAQKLGLAIADYLDILSSRGRVLTIIRDELGAIRDEFATPRKTELIDAETEMEDEALIEREDVAVTVTHNGYINRTPWPNTGAGPRRRAAPAWRRGTSIPSASPWPPAMPGCSFFHRHGLQAQGLAPAGSAHAGAGSDGQPVAAGRAHHHHPGPAGNNPEWDKLNVCSPPSRACGATSCRISSRSTRTARRHEAGDGDGIIGVATCIDADDSC